MKEEILEKLTDIAEILCVGLGVHYDYESGRYVLDSQTKQEEKK